MSDFIYVSKNVLFCRFECIFSFFFPRKINLISLTIDYIYDRSISEDIQMRTHGEKNVKFSYFERKIDKFSIDSSNLIQQEFNGSILALTSYEYSQQSPRKSCLELNASGIQKFSITWKLFETLTETVFLHTALSERCFHVEEKHYL